MSDDVPRNDLAVEDRPDESPDSRGQDSSRRRFFEIASCVLGVLAGVGPALVGMVAFLDPLWRVAGKPKLHRVGTGDGNSKLIRVASINALSLNAPQRFLVIDDQIDAWNFSPDQPVGAVYIERLSDSKVRVFNTTCPHAGCSVACNGAAYHCPCHHSSFNLDGSKLVSKSGRANPSPRDLDSLDYEIRKGEIWVDFKNFFTGKHKKEEKA